jgi:hypothetical protein
VLCRCMDPVEMIEVVLKEEMGRSYKQPAGIAE